MFQSLLLSVSIILLMDVGKAWKERRMLGYRRKRLAYFAMELLWNYLRWIFLLFTGERELTFSCTVYLVGIYWKNHATIIRRILEPFIYCPFPHLTHYFSAVVNCPCLQSSLSWQVEPHMLLRGSCLGPSGRSLLVSFPGLGLPSATVYPIQVTHGGS